MIEAEELYDRLRNLSHEHTLCSYTLERCRSLVGPINRIRALKKEHNAIVLAHTYVHPDILYGVADFVGDSYSLSKEAQKTDADWIVFPSVRFMAETAKILCPAKMVIDPNPNGGCSLADSVSADQVRELRRLYPDHTFICYINTTAAVKAECDVCVTSSNFLRILERIPSNKLYFLPDKLMGENGKRELAARGIEKEVLLYPGTCYVHEEMQVDQIEAARAAHPNALIAAHPECAAPVAARADFVGSTSDMQRFVMEKKHLNRPFLLLSECGVASRISVEIPDARLVGSCSMCKYMRSNSLSEIECALRAPKPTQIIEIAPSIRERALKTLERMFQYGG